MASDKKHLSTKEQEVISMVRARAEKMMEACEKVSRGEMDFQDFGELMESRISKTIICPACGGSGCALCAIIR